MRFTPAGQEHSHGGTATNMMCHYAIIDAAGNGEATALAWAIDHPGGTSAIIGPRTMEQLESQLPAADVTLNTEILDRIDELVAPGVTLNADDNSYGAVELTPQVRRR